MPSAHEWQPQWNCRHSSVGILSTLIALPAIKNSPPLLLPESEIAVLQTAFPHCCKAACRFVSTLQANTNPPHPQPALSHTHILYYTQNGSGARCNKFGACVCTAIMFWCNLRRARSAFIYIHEKQIEPASDWYCCADWAHAPPQVSYFIHPLRQKPRFCAGN